MQRRSGNLLPPPADEFSNNNTSAWPKPISKITPNVRYFELNFLFDGNSILRLFYISNFRAIMIKNLG